MADRYDDYRFSMLTCEAPAHGGSELKRFVSVVMPRIRKSDIAGWPGDNQIGILLPFTTGDRARSLAADVQERLPGSPLNVNIHVYPLSHYGGRRNNAVEASGGPFHEPGEGRAKANTGSSNQGAYEITLAAGSPSIEEYCCLPTPFWKRAVDNSVALMGILFLCPLLLLLAVYIRASSRGPVLFKQQRVGLGGKPFTIWKFRTMQMRHDARRHEAYVANLMDNDQELKKLDTAAELIPLGTWLRRSGIDELPQLFNVLRGSMSLVGPRPDVIPFHAYPPWQRHRFDVLPGITGLWQVRGKHSTTFKQMARLDIEYARRRSFGFDLRILLMTVPAIIRQTNED